MKLRHHLGRNFGDALNKDLFEKLLPDFFDNDDSEVFLGIGSILGLVELGSNTKIVHVFTSGYAYGKMPSWKDRVEVNYMAVRGRLTAQKFGLEGSVFEADGGILAGELLDAADRSAPKKYKWSYIPHHYSTDKYSGFEDLCERAGVHYIDPNISEENTVLDVIKDINSTEFLIAEAMHGAIIADSLGVPFIPVKSYRHINEFKWQDYASAFGLKIDLHWLERLYSEPFFISKMKEYAKTPVGMGKIAFRLAKGVSLFDEDKFIKRMKALKNDQFLVLSERRLMKEKQEHLLLVLEAFRLENK